MALELPFGYKQTTASANVDEAYGPYQSLAAARAAVPIGLRALGRVVGIIESGKVVDYIWESGIQDSDLVLKVTKDDTKVDKESGKSLVSDSEINKLENLKSQTEIDSDIATATSNASSQLIVVSGTVLPRGNDIPEYITTTGKAELLGGNAEGGKTFTNTGTTPSTFNVPKGSIGYAYYDKSSDSWTLKDLSELPSVPLADDYGDSTGDAATQRLVTEVKTNLDGNFKTKSNNVYSGGIVDEENKILLGFDKQGKLISVQFGQEVIDFSALKNVAISYQDLSEGVTSLMYSSEDNAEYSLAFIDEEDKVLLGVKKDGRVIAGGVDITALNDAVSTLIVENEKVIVCLGDSLTAGAGGGGTRYTTVLQTLVGSDYLVANRGVGGENVPTIAARQGSVPSVLPFDVVLPASASTTVQVATNSTRLHNMLFPEVSISPLLQGNTTNVNPVYVDNIECTLIREGEGTGVNWSLKRNINGSSDAILKQGTPILMRDAYTYHAPYAAIIFVGQNGGYSSSTENLIDYQKRIVDFYGTSNYLILGLTSGTAESREELENAQLASFGNRYVNLRHLISKYGLIDADLEPTQDDIDAMAVGSIPPSLLFDAVHFNAYGYTVIGKYVNDRLKQLNIV